MRQASRITAVVALAIAGSVAMHTALARRGTIAPWTVPPDPHPLPAPVLETFDVGSLRVQWVQAPVPLFEARLFLAFPTDMPTMTKLVQAALFQIEGTQACPGDAWPQCLDRAGAVLDVDVDPDYLTLIVRADMNEAPAALKLLADLVVHPRNTTQGLGLVKSTLREWTARRLEDPAAVATDRLFKQLFGDHPYASQIAYAEIADLSFEATVGWRQRMTCPADSLLVVTSPFGEAAVQGWVTSGFSEWESCPDDEAEPSPTPVPPPPGESAGVRLEATLPGDRSAMVAGGRLDITDCDQVGTARVVSRLITQRVAGETAGGAAFGAEVRPYARGGIWWVWLSATDDEDARLLWDVLADIRQGEITRRAINQAIRAEIATTLAQAGDFTELVGLEAKAGLSDGSCLATPTTYLTWLQHLSPRRVPALARDLLDLDALVVVTCGPGLETTPDAVPVEDKETPRSPESDPIPPSPRP